MPSLAAHGPDCRLARGAISYFATARRPNPLFSTDARSLRGPQKWEEGFAVGSVSIGKDSIKEGLG